MPTYDQEVAADNPAVYHKLSETSGTVAKDSGSKKWDADVANLTMGAAPIAQGLGTSFRYTGDTSTMQVPAALLGAIDVTAGYTQEMWFKPEDGYSTNGNNLHYLENLAYLYTSNTTGTLLAESHATDETINSITSTSPLTLGQAYHIVARMKADGTLDLFLNGVLDTSAALKPVGVRTISAYSIGGYEHNWPTRGFVSNAAFYTTALSDARILAHYTAGIAAPAPIGDTRPLSSAPVKRFKPTVPRPGRRR